MNVKQRVKNLGAQATKREKPEVKITVVITGEDEDREVPEGVTVIRIGGEEPAK